ncbi:MAG: hypothetical protein AAF975_04985 [Spirochaetota bacterium]
MSPSVYKSVFRLASRWAGGGRSLFPLCFLLLSWLLFFGCFASRRSLTISLDETPLYSEQQWALVKIPYAKISKDFASSEIDGILGMLRFGQIVTVQRIQKKAEDGAVWAFVFWDRELLGASEETPLSTIGSVENKDKEDNISLKDSMQGWMPLSFLHMAGSLKEAQLARRQILEGSRFN